MFNRLGIRDLYQSEEVYKLTQFWGGGCFKIFKGLVSLVEN